MSKTDAVLKAALSMIHNALNNARTNLTLEEQIPAPLRTPVLHSYSVNSFNSINFWPCDQVKDSYSSAVCVSSAVYVSDLWTWSSHPDSRWYRISSSTGWVPSANIQSPRSSIIGKNRLLSSIGWVASARWCSGSSADTWGYGSYTKIYGLRAANLYKKGLVRSNWEEIMTEIFNWRDLLFQFNFNSFEANINDCLIDRKMAYIYEPISLAKPGFSLLSQKTQYQNNTPSLCGKTKRIHQLIISAKKRYSILKIVNKLGSVELNLLVKLFTNNLICIFRPVKSLYASLSNLSLASYSHSNNWTPSAAMSGYPPKVKGDNG